MKHMMISGWNKEASHRHIFCIHTYIYIYILMILWEMLMKVTELVSYWNCHVLIPMSCLVGPGINNDGCNSNYEGGVPVGA